ncbi:MAG: hypothetical protein OEW67_02515 [Cyclobacteriaceae bacterium]|nr:hypothetical protein [Cyclobacteriaceae bacterium]
MKKYQIICYILIINIFFSSCTWYKVIKSDHPSSFINDPKKTLPPYVNHYILHFEDELLELATVVINKNNQTISGKPIPFEGLQREYYDKIKKYNGSTTLKTNKEHRSAVKQIHLYVQNYSSTEDGKLSFNFDDILKVEVSQMAYGKTTFTTITLATLGVVAGGAIFLAIACGCPHVYIDNNGTYELNSTLFTGANASQLERHDYKTLPNHISSSDNFELKIVNEEEESQFTDLLELLAVYHSDSVEVLVDKDGNFHTIVKPITAKKGVDNGTNNILDEIAIADNNSYRFNADSTKRLSEVFVTFEKPKNITNGKLILTLKNSKWAGIVYNEFSSLFGKRYEYWVKKNQDKPREDRLKWMKEQGINLLVDVKTDNGWENIEYVELVGDVSYNSIVVPMNFLNKSKDIEIRLRSGFMFWELDYVGMDYSENTSLDVQILKPIYAKGNNGEDFVSALSTEDEYYMVHLEDGSSTKVKFEPIEIQEGKSSTVLIHSKGYYIMNKNYSGKVYRKELAKFIEPGELSRFSQKLYNYEMRGVTIIE